MQEKGDIMANEQRLDGGIRRAALYIRVSTEEQAIHGLSLPTQQARLTEYARENGLKVVDIYADQGITARKKYKNRLQFMRMLRDVEADKIDVILFIKLDRWFRNVADYYEVQRILDAHHVHWIATEEEYDTTTANGRLHLNIKLSIAQDESDRTSERIKFVFEGKKERGEVVSGKVPLGYAIENKRMAVDPDTAPIVRDIFAQFVAQRSLRALREYLMHQYSMIYCISGLRALLSNRRYIGEAHGSSDFCPAIIDQETFDHVQSILSERAQRNAHFKSERVYLFTGMVYCAECGNRLSAHTVDRKYIYYRCTKYDKLHQCSHKHRTSELILEDWLVRNLRSQYADYNARIEATFRARPAVDTTLIRRKMEKLKDLYLNDLIDRESYVQDYTALKQTLEELETPEQQAPKPVDLEELSSVLALYSGFDRPQKKAFWSRLVGKIIISNDDDFSVVPPLSYYH